MSHDDFTAAKASLAEVFHWLLLGGVLVLGATLRFWRIRECGLSMWDEYSYVRSAQWISTLGRAGHPHAPDVAPPLYPVWVAVCFLLAGDHDWVAVCASAIASFLTLPVLYLLGFRLYGRSAALVATAFLAANPYNIIYARQAVTDATFQLLFVVTVIILFLLARTGRRRWLFWGGVALGLCETTKYHGFFAWCAVVPESLGGFWRKEITARILTERLLLPIAVGFAVFLPWLVLVAHEWGIGKLVQHYIGYSSLRVISHGNPLQLSEYLRLWCGPWLLLAAGVGLWGAARHRQEGDGILFTWLILFAGGSFLYFAYPRLILPVTACLALAAGRAVLLFPPGAVRRWSAALLCGVALVTGWAASYRHLGPYGTGYRAAGAYLASQAASGAMVATLAQPVLWHYVGHPLKDLSEPEIQRRLRAGDPMIVAVDLVVFRPENSLLLQRNAGGFELLRTFVNPVSEPDILTALGPDAFREYKRNPRDSRWDLVGTIQVLRITRPWVFAEIAAAWHRSLV